MKFYLRRCSCCQKKFRAKEPSQQLCGYCRFEDMLSQPASIDEAGKPGFWPAIFNKLDQRLDQQKKEE